MEHTIYWAGCEFDPEGIVFYDPPYGVCEGGASLNDNWYYEPPEWLRYDNNS